MSGRAVGKMNSMKECRLTVRVNADLRRRLSAAAKKAGKRQSEMVRETLEARFPRRPRKGSALEVLERLGLVGMITDGPPDLSTNKKYFEGFGES